MSETIDITQVLPQTTVEDVEDFLIEEEMYEEYDGSEPLLVTAYRDISSDFQTIERALSPLNTTVDLLVDIKRYQTCMETYGLTQALAELCPYLSMATESLPMATCVPTQEAQIAIESFSDNADLIKEWLIRSLMRLLDFFTNILRKIIHFFKMYSARATALSKTLRGAKLDTTKAVALSRGVMPKLVAWKEAYLQITRVGEISNPILRSNVHSVKSDVDESLRILKEVVDFPYAKERTRQLLEIDWSVRAITDYDNKIVQLARDFEINVPRMIDRLNYLTKLLGRQVATQQYTAEELKLLSSQVTTLKRLYHNYWALTNDLIMQWMAVGVAFTKCIVRENP